MVSLKSGLFIQVCINHRSVWRRRRRQRVSPALALSLFQLDHCCCCCSSSRSSNRLAAAVARWPSSMGDYDQPLLSNLSLGFSKLGCLYISTKCTYTHSIHLPRKHEKKPISISLRVTIYQCETTPGEIGRYDILPIAHGVLHAFTWQTNCSRTV